MSEQLFSGKETCPHCSNAAPMEIVAKYGRIVTYGEHPIEGFDTSVNYELLKCPACQDILLRKFFWNDLRDDPSNVRYQLLYPVPTTGPVGLPLKVSTTYEEAQKVRNISPNAYAVLLGRVLEEVCSDRRAKGRTLSAKLKDLSDRGEIPEKLVKVASGLRGLRNVGAHSGAGVLTATETPIIDKLCSAILDYVYSASILAEEAPHLLDNLQKR